MNTNHLSFTFPAFFRGTLRRPYHWTFWSQIPLIYQGTRSCAVQSSSSEVKLAASTVLFRCNPPYSIDKDVQVLLVKRGKSPNQNLWALPGGSANSGEALHAAAARELHEETRFPLNNVTYLPNPFLHRFIPVPNTNISYHIHVFCAFSNDISFCPVASDDAADAQFFEIDQFDTLETVPSLYSIVLKALHVLKTRSPDDNV